MSACCSQHPVSRRPVESGGSCRLVLTYPGGSGAVGKTGAGSDVVEARVVEVVDGVRVVQQIDFESDDPVYAGTMTMTRSLTPTDAGARVEIRADDVPEGISAQDHQTGMTSSLANLDAYVTGAPRAGTAPVGTSPVDARIFDAGLCPDSATSGRAGP